MRALFMASGIVVWALHFALIYGYTGLACARGFGSSAPWVVAAATLLAAVTLIAIILTHLSSEFTRWMTAMLAGAALIGILWEGAPVFMVPPCG